MAQAGVLSYVTGLFFGSDKAVAAAPSDNLQTLDLLEAVASAHPNTSSGGADVEIVGGSALMPETGPVSLGDVDEPARNGGQISMYVVRPGDSLSQIARMFGVSENTIVWTNDLKSKTVREGQVLVILPITGVKHTVKKGDTIESIAKAYKGDAAEIRDFNGLKDGAALAAGSVVIIPDGEMEIAAPKRRSTPSSGSRANIPSVSINTEIASGWLIRPVSGGVRTQGIHGYNGIDIGIPVGSTVFASASGQVVISKGSGWNGGYGGYIVIAHDNGAQTLYSHLSGSIVEQGQRVVQGQVIGYTGNSGRSTGPHLHFEVRGARNPF